MTERERRTGPVVAALCVTAAVAFWQAPEADWNLALFGILLAFSVFSDLTAIDTESGSRSPAASWRWSWRWSSWAGRRQR